MAKKRKKTHRAPKTTAKDLSKGSADPLALPAWASAASSPEEAEERARFDQAWSAFRRGDFRQCRSEATRLAADATSGVVRRRVRALLDRMQVDPLALGMAAVALALLLTAVLWTFA